MTIVISMAGLSQRFSRAGITIPKYMLYIKNKSLFSLTVSSFSNYFQDCDFLFIARNIFDTKKFIEEECKLLGINNFKIELLNRLTEGQSETVFLGLNNSKVEDKESLTIFNIDTIRNNFRFPSNLNSWDGYLEVFLGEGANWSYAKTESLNSTRVVETSEKVQISNYCSTGLYYFKSAAIFRSAFLLNRLVQQTNNTNELYVAPLYNILIKQNKNIHIDLINKEDVQFCGIPEEYYSFLKQSI